MGTSQLDPSCLPTSPLLSTHATRQTMHGAHVQAPRLCDAITNSRLQGQPLVERFSACPPVPPINA